MDKIVKSYIVHNNWNLNKNFCPLSASQKRKVGCKKAFADKYATGFWTMLKKNYFFLKTTLNFKLFKKKTKFFLFIICKKIFLRSFCDKLQWFSSEKTHNKLFSSDFGQYLVGYNLLNYLLVLLLDYLIVWFNLILVNKRIYFSNKWFFSLNAKDCHYSQAFKSIKRSKNKALHFVRTQITRNFLLQIFYIQK